MNRTDDADRAVDGNGTGRDGFTEGQTSPTVIPRTIVGETFLNDLQEEVVRSIELANLTPRSGSTSDPGGWEQLWESVGRARVALSNWTLEANAGPDDMYAVGADGAGNFVSVGVGGNVYYLADIDANAQYAAPTWTAGTNGETDALADVAFYGGRWTAVGLNGCIITSDDDGATWTARTSGVATALYAVAHNGARWLAVGQSGVILTSTDAETWTSQTSGTSATLRSIAWSPTLAKWYVGAIGDELLSAVSAGVTWTILNLTGIEDVHGLRWLNGRLVATGSEPSPGTDQITATSLDGTTWTTGTAFSDAGGDNADLLYILGFYIRVGYTVRLSKDALDWSAPRRTRHNSNGPGRSAFDADRLVIPAAGGVCASDRIGT